MRELTCNMLNTECDVLVVTTNGFVKANGECVMGKGIAKQIANIDPSIPKLLGSLIRTNGNIVQYITDIDGIKIVAFPVKPISAISDGTNYVSHMSFPIGSKIPGWACKADISIIEASLLQLADLVLPYNANTILCPRFGCGAGELSWETVKPIAERYLDDTFIACTF